MCTSVHNPMPWATHLVAWTPSPNPPLPPTQPLMCHIVQTSIKEAPMVAPFSARVGVILPVDAQPYPYPWPPTMGPDQKG